MCAERRESGFETRRLVGDRAAAARGTDNVVGAASANDVANDAADDATRGKFASAVGRRGHQSGRRGPRATAPARSAGASLAVFRKYPGHGHGGGYGCGGCSDVRPDFSDYCPRHARRRRRRRRRRRTSRAKILVATSRRLGASVADAAANTTIRRRRRLVSRSSKSAATNATAAASGAAVFRDARRPRCEYFFHLTADGAPTTDAAAADHDRIARTRSLIFFSSHQGPTAASPSRTRPTDCPKKSRTRRLGHASESFGPRVCRRRRRR